MSLKAQKKTQVESQRLSLAELAPLATPLVIYVEASSLCNLACTFCPHYIDPEGLHKQNMELDVFKKIIDDCSEFDQKLKLLRICGTGDATMNKQLKDMLSYAGKKDIAEKFEMITNGILLNEELISVISKSLTRIIISIEGLNDEEYFKFTNRRVRYEKLVAKVQMLYKNRGNCKVHIKIHNSAVPTQEDKELFFKTFDTYCDEINIENLVDLWPGTDASHGSLGNDPVHRFSGEEFERVSVCSQIFKTMQVNSDGSVIPCSIDWEAKNKIGNIESESLLSIWNSEEMRKIRIKHLQGKRFDFLPCKECTFNEVSDVDNLDKYAESILSKLDASPIGVSMI
jgi:radical SAM protein with 4Fe4S-binding SPASM domain